MLDKLRWGSGSPEGVVFAPPATLYQDLSGGAVYRKSGSGTTGWVALADVGGGAVVPTPPATPVTFSVRVGQAGTLSGVVHSPLAQTGATVYYRSTINYAPDSASAWADLKMTVTAGWVLFVMGAAAVRTSGLPQAAMSLTDGVQVNANEGSILVVVTYLLIKV